ncbi:hypothetical protein CHS0354_038446 [Potamilus streckersoni]|uniref:VWFA domain-containing protein n=1 Tax=Potamilus streckersoni TaxID=2493646 RepID=A0AAE0S6Q2_9BIVA|nr:hypothetical protein CHS0354_038446 [Potamilus streckersoni]
MATILPPARLMEVVFSFDTTGSMASYLEEVRGRLQDMVQRLQADIHGIRIAIFAHGDYCDAHNYVTKYVDFTDSVADLCEFVKNVGSTGGGDSDECYELVLHEVRTKLSWTPGSRRLLVLIGDANPHEPNYPQNTMKLDWRVEADKLMERAVHIYGVHCGSCSNGDFYKTIAEKTCGRYLKLNELQNIFDLIMAVCYREKGEDFLSMYEKEVRDRCAREGMHKELDTMFGMLRKASSVESHATVILPTAKKFAPKKLSKPAMLKKGGLKKYTVKTKDTSSSKLGKRIRGKKLIKESHKTDPHLKRENVPETNFMLRDLNWSPWQVAIVPDAPECSASRWRKRCGDGSGYIRRELFGEKMNVMAFYEVAVQMKFRAKKFVVFSKFVKSCKNWERKLVGKPDIKAQIDDVIKRHCKVYIRRVVLKRRQVQKKIILDIQNYDYAWCKISGRRLGHRMVTKANVRISDDALLCPA